MEKGAFDRFVESVINWLLDELVTGRRGEALTERKLKAINNYGYKGRILRNLYVPKPDGQTSEIDVVYITQKGIFVFESKNYSGWIFGDSGEMYWTAMLPNGEKNRFYNPIKQNRSHLKWLAVYLGTDVPMFSIVVFSNRCELKKVKVGTDEIVIKRDRLNEIIRGIMNSADDALTEEQVAAVYERLELLTKADRETKRAHIQNIRQREFEKPKPLISNSMVCPRCGKPLVQRTARKGSGAGNLFYGCSGFPNCHYTRNI